MFGISKEEYMKREGTSQEEQDSLIPITFDIFRYLKVGDRIYKVCDWTYFIKLPFEIDYAKWLPSPPGCYTSKGKTFVYKQISFVRNENKLYADSAGHNYRDLYIHSSLLKEIENRKRNKKQSRRLS